MKHSTTDLMDLPDEIILIILKKLDNVQMLYALMNINVRLNQILHDPIFTEKINFRTTNGISLTQSEIFFDRFCVEILPKMNDQISIVRTRSSC